MVIDYLFRVVHAAVTDLDGVSVEDLVEAKTPVQTSDTKSSP